MVGGSALFTRNFYVHAVPGRSDHHYLWVGRLASGGLLAAGNYVAVRAESVTQLVLGSVKLIGLLGAAFWLGVVWRRATAVAVWSSFLGSLLVWAVMSAETPARDTARRSDRARSSGCRPAARAAGAERADSDHHHASVEFGLMILVSLVTRPRDLAVLGPFYARLHTPVGKEDEVRVTSLSMNCPSRPRWAWTGPCSITASRPASLTRGFKSSVWKSRA